MYSSGRRRDDGTEKHFEFGGGKRPPPPCLLLADVSGVCSSCTNRYRFVVFIIIIAIIFHANALHQTHQTTFFGRKIQILWKTLRRPTLFCHFHFYDSNPNHSELRFYVDGKMMHDFSIHIANHNFHRRTKHLNGLKHFRLKFVLCTFLSLFFYVSLCILT